MAKAPVTIITDEGDGKSAIKLTPKTTASVDTVTLNAAKELNSRGFGGLGIDGAPADPATITPAQAIEVTGDYLQHVLEGLSEVWAGKEVDAANAATKQAAIEAAKLKNA